MKRFLFIVISFISISSAKADDIEIATASQLRAFANSVNDGNAYAGNLKVNVSGSATGNVAGLSVVSVRVELCRVWVCAAATSISVPNHPII